MAETAQREEARWKGRMRRRRGRREPAAQGTCQHTSTVGLKPQPKTTRQRCEYRKEAAALVGGPSSVGPAPAEAGHGAACAHRSQHAGPGRRGGAGTQIRVAYPGLLSPFYTNDAAFDGSARRSVQLLKLLMKRGPEWGYFLEPANSLFISDTPGKEEAAKRDFTKEGACVELCKWE